MERSNTQPMASETYFASFLYFISFLYRSIFISSFHRVMDKYTITVGIFQRDFRFFQSRTSFFIINNGSSIEHTLNMVFHIRISFHFYGTAFLCFPQDLHRFSTWQIGRKSMFSTGFSTKMAFCPFFAKNERIFSQVETKFWLTLAQLGTDLNQSWSELVRISIRNASKKRFPNR